MGIQDSIQAAIKDAMRAKDKQVLQTLRLISAAFKQIEVDKKIKITDETALIELVRQVKQRQDSAKQYRDAGREDLAQHEETEIAIIRRFLPEQMSQQAMQAHVDQVIIDSGLALEMASMGPLMAKLKQDLQGRVNMADVNQYLRQKLQSS